MPCTRFHNLKISQFQVIIFMALADGVSRVLVGPLSMHTRTAIRCAFTTDRSKLDCRPHSIAIYVSKWQCSSVTIKILSRLISIQSCSETEGGSPLGTGLSIRTVMAGLIQLQKSPSAPPLKGQHHSSSSQQHSVLRSRPAFEFPAPPPPPPHGTFFAGSSRVLVRNLRHRSDESLSGIGSSTRGEAYSRR